MSPDDALFCSFCGFDPQGVRPRMMKPTIQPLAQFVHVEHMYEPEEHYVETAARKPQEASLRETLDRFHNQDLEFGGLEAERSQDRLQALPKQAPREGLQTGSLLDDLGATYGQKSSGSLAYSTRPETAPKLLRRTPSSGISSKTPLPNTSVVRGAVPPTSKQPHSQISQSSQTLRAVVATRTNAQPACMKEAEAGLSQLCWDEFATEPNTQEFWREWQKRLRFVENRDIMVGGFVLEEVRLESLIKFCCGNNAELQVIEDPWVALRTLYQRIPHLLIVRVLPQGLDKWLVLFRELARASELKRIPLLLFCEQNMKALMMQELIEQDSLLFFPTEE